jgi:hypothetical protein
LGSLGSSWGRTTNKNKLADVQVNIAIDQALRVDI